MNSGIAHPPCRIRVYAWSLEWGPLKHVASRRLTLLRSGANRTWLSFGTGPAGVRRDPRQEPVVSFGVDRERHGGSCGVYRPVGQAELSTSTDELKAIKFLAAKPGGN